MKKILSLVTLVLLAVTSYAHVWEVRVNQNQDGTLTWYLQSYHVHNECGIANSGLTINGVNYQSVSEHPGSIVGLSNTVFANTGTKTYQRGSYAIVNTPYLGQNINVKPYSENACWYFLVGGTGSFTPPPPPQCTTCPIVSWTNTTGTPNINGTSCDYTDDYLPTTITVNHLACADITKGGKFRVIVDPNGANTSYGPYSFAAGITTTVNLNMPYGTSNSTQISVVSDSFPCAETHGLTIPGGTFTGVKETVAPYIAVPNNPTFNTTTGLNGAKVNYNVTPYDNCGAAGVTLVRTAGPASGSTFPIGTTTVTYTATDAAGNTSTRSFTVTVVDNEKPKITAPANVTVNVDNGSNVATSVALGTATATDNSGTATVTNNGLTSYPLGTTTVTWTATDPSGNTATATQTVTVIDNQPPSITAPADVTVNTDNGASTASNVALGTATATDNSGTATVTNNGLTNYPVGTTTVTWTATDAAGNTATATQKVNVIDNQPPSITAPANVTVSTDNGTSTATNVALGNPITSDNVGIASTTNDAPAIFPLGTTIVTWTVTDAAGNSTTATQVVTVVDNEAPMIAAPADVTVGTDNGASTASNVALGSATASDNVGVASTTNNGLSVYPLGTTVVTWTVTDAAGNTATATQNVTVVDNENPTITAPLDVTVNTDNGASTASNVALGNAVTNDNVGVTSTTNNGLTNYPVGVTVVTWTVMDAAGNTATATQNVTVVDNEAPTVAAPADVTVSTDNGVSTASNVNLGNATSSDNVGVVSTSNDAPANYPLGTTVVTWTVIDAAGNTATATQNVTVVDNEAPMIAAPADVTVNTDNGSNVATNVALGSATASDNVGVTSTTNDAPANYPLGTTVVTWTATDAAGNTATATQNVTVVDNEAPIIAAPADVTVNTDNGSNLATNVALGSATASDNVGVTSITNNALSSYPVGTTVVTWTATDAAGNTATATQNVTVVDNEAPNAICQNFTLNLSNGSGTVAPSDIDNGSSDNVGIASMTVTPNTFTCADAGTKSVTLTVTDLSGNSTTCTANVSVQYQPSCTITTALSSNVYTGGNSNTIYLGYGPQSATLTANATGGSGFTYSWSPSTGLSNPNVQSPVFTPTAGGNYTYTVTVTNSNGCSVTSEVSFCVRDIQVYNKKGKNTGKVYLCHVPPGNNNNPQTLSVSVNAVASHLSGHNGDRLGKCDESCTSGAKNGKGNTANANEENKNQIGSIEATAAGFRLYPNPNNGTFTLEMPSKDAATVVMSNISGQVVYRTQTEGTQKLMINVDNVRQGIYMLHISSGESTYHTKVIIH